MLRFHRPLLALLAVVAALAFTVASVDARPIEQLRQPRQPHLLRAGGDATPRRAPRRSSAP